MTRPDCVATVLDILADRDVWAEDRQALEAYVAELEEKVSSLKEVTAAAMTLCDVLRQQTEACQAREAYLREVLEAQPRRMEWVRVDGIFPEEVPDYATRLRDQALAAPQDRTALDEQIARAREEGAERAALALETQHSWITNVAAATVARAAGRQP